MKLREIEDVGARQSGAWRRGLCADEQSGTVGSEATGESKEVRRRAVRSIKPKGPSTKMIKPKA